MAEQEERQSHPAPQSQPEPGPDPKKSTQNQTPASASQSAATTSPTDPANPSSTNTDHTTSTTAKKPSSAVSALLDSEFRPSLDDAPFLQKAKSHALLLGLLIAAVGSLWVAGYPLTTFASSHTNKDDHAPTPLLPTSSPPSLLGSGLLLLRQKLLSLVGLHGYEGALGIVLFFCVAVAALWSALYVVGATNIDFWALGIEWGWYTLPVVGLLAVGFVILRERTEGMGDVG